VRWLAVAVRIPLGWLGVFLLLVTGPARVWGIGSPPLITDDPGTPGAGHWEINLGLSTERRPGLQLSEAPAVDLNYGVGDAVQLKFEVPFLIKEESGEARQSGFGNAGVGVKWRFHDTGEAGFAVSVYPQLEFSSPNSSADERGLVEPGSAFLLPVQWEKRLGAVTVNAQVGREFRATGNAWYYGLAVTLRKHERFASAIEFVGSASPRLEHSWLAVNVGVVLDVSDSVSLLASIGRDLRNDLEPRASVFGYLGWQIRL
jgi:hypothetical protein